MGRQTNIPQTAHIHGTPLTVPYHVDPGSTGTENLWYVGFWPNYDVAHSPRIVYRTCALWELTIPYTIRVHIL